MAFRPTNAVPDFGRTACDYGRFRAGFPDSIYARLLAHGIGERGQLVVDLGTGTGTLARGFALRGCRTIGIDPALTMLEEARGIDAACGAVVDYRVARAEQTGLDARSADVVVAGQCWHWFDRAAAAAEAARVLRSSGKIAITHFDWLPFASNVVAQTERLIERHNPAWKGGGGLGMYPRWLRDLGEAGYRGIETFSYDEDASYTHEAWRGRVRASAGIGASLTCEQVGAFDRDLAEVLASQFADEPVAVPHRVFAVVAQAPD